MPADFPFNKTGFRTGVDLFSYRMSIFVKFVDDPDVLIS
jgi:hypothetical protein